MSTTEITATTDVTITVTLKPSVHDPQGEAIARALSDLGIAGIESVRVGKHIELEIDADVDAAAAAQAAVDRLLVNPVIETHTIEVDA